MNTFNAVFQADETKSGAERLLWKLLVKFNLMKHVKRMELQEIAVSYQKLQHNDETISVGMAAGSYLHNEDLIYPRIQQQFFAGARAFYAAAVQKMVKKFPLGDPVLQDLVALDPTKKADLDHAPVERLAARFAPQVDTELLEDEWDDFKLLEERMQPCPWWMTRANARSWTSCKMKFYLD